MNRHTAFSLIELLVVITVIAILAGMILMSVGPIKARIAAQKTAASMASIISAMSRRTADTGGTVALAEHPLAGSVAPRSAFVRQSGGAVAKAGEALFGIELAQLSDAAQADRLLLPSDRFADPLSPMLFGMRRSSLCILGCPRAPITSYRRLALPDRALTVASTATSGFAVVTSAGTIEHDRAISLALGDDALKALIADGVAWSPPTDAPLGLADRVWTGTFPITTQRPGSSAMVAGTPQPYRLRGIGLYDAWGRELLFESLSGGQFRIVSAGRDGYFRFSPGADGVFQTAAESDVPAGDDRDAASDTIASMPEPAR